MRSFSMNKTKFLCGKHYLQKLK